MLQVDKYFILTVLLLLLVVDKYFILTYLLLLLLLLLSLARRTFGRIVISQFTMILV